MTEVRPPLRIALVGTGFIGKRHVGFIRSQRAFELVAAADPGPGADAYCREQGIKHYADYRRMIEAERPDGVIVGTPNHLHAEVAIAAIEAGIPTLVEKPVADTLEAALRIDAAAKKNGVAVLVGHHRRHNPKMRAARTFLNEGSLGSLVSIAAQNLRRKPDSYYQATWRREPGGGPMLINGIHDIDCLRFLCGEIESVYALTSNKTRGFAVEDTAAITLQFENGAIGNLTLSDAVQGPWAWEIASGEEPEYPHEPVDVFYICGTEGALAVPTMNHWRNERGGGRADPFIRKQLFYVPADPWVEQLIHFGRVIRGEEKPILPPDDAARTLAAVLAVERSAATGQPVKVCDLFQKDA